MRGISFLFMALKKKGNCSINNVQPRHLKNDCIKDHQEFPVNNNQNPFVLKAMKCVTGYFNDY